MRIIAGKLRSRPLKARVPEGTRPTSDRLRETLFNILGHRVIESMFLDAYAGTGGVGIEAISRGAELVHFVERSDRAAAAIRANLAALGVTRGFRILHTDLNLALEACLGESVRFDLVYLDPPYDEEKRYRADLENLGSGRILEPGAWVVAEHRRNVELPDMAGQLRRFRDRKQGSSTLSFYEAESP